VSRLVEDLMVATTAPRGVERALARKREKYEDEVARLTAAALAVMEERDTVDPRVSDILEHAGLSTAAMYRHFPTKDDLLLTLIEEAGANTRSYLGHRLEGVTDPMERIVEWIRGMFAMLGEDSLVTRNRPFLLAHPRLLERFPDEIGAMVDRLIEPLAEAMTHADMSDATAEVEARLIYHLVFGLLIDHAAQRRTVDEEQIDGVVGHCLRAIGAVERRATGSRGRSRRPRN
jgi:AcrR family transcriptional regulator